MYKTHQIYMVLAPAVAVAAVHAAVSERLNTNKFFFHLDVASQVESLTTATASITTLPTNIDHLTIYHCWPLFSPIPIQYKDRLQNMTEIENR